MMFYKETDFKEEPAIGNIPKEWEVARLKDVADYLNGYPFSPDDWKDKGLPIIRIQNLNDPTAEFNYFQGDVEERYKRYIVKNGDLLFSWSASIGAYIWNRGKAVLNQHIFKVFPNDDVDKLYLYYALFLAIEQLKQKVHGSTMKHFRKTELQTKIPLPSIPEQKKIAEVLGVVDLAVAKTGEVIAKTELLKKGLMQELLTKGIGHIEYKQTPIGKIPKAWNIVTLGEVCEFLDSLRIPLKEQDRAKRRGLYPYYGAQGIIDWIDGYLFDGEHVLLAEDGENLRSKKLPIAFKVGGKFWVNNHAHVLKLTSDKVATDFIVYMLNFINIRPHIVGSAQPKLNQSEARKISLPLPPLSEQEKIASTISTVDKKLDLENKQKIRLHSIKRGLMDLLLTGKIRIKVN